MVLDITSDFVPYKHKIEVNQMGKGFSGPFRIAHVEDAQVDRAGDLFLTLQDDRSNVIGIILRSEAFKELVDVLNAITSKEESSGTELGPSVQRSMDARA
jgi:hypothetical protein